MPLSVLGKKQGPSFRVLVVDDNVDTARTWAMLLKLNGHEVQMAHDGECALAATRCYRPHLILLDLGLTGMNGFDVAKKVREEPELDKVVLVAMTGYGRDTDKQRSQEVGFNHHLVKPSSYGEVQKILASLSQSES